MHRRQFLQALSAAGVLGGLPLSGLANTSPIGGAISVADLPELKGELTLYLGRGEGGLYESILDAISKRNPEFTLNIRRGSTAALANTLMAESRAGVLRADVFWAVDSGAIGAVREAGLGQALPQDIRQQLSPNFQYADWAPISGRIRTLPYHTARVNVDNIPRHIADLADSGLTIGWAPAYASFQSFITAMRVLKGDQATTEWLKAIRQHAKPFAGELGVVMAVERGEVDIGFANHYYTLRLKAGKPDAQVALAFTEQDAGCLLNASGAMAVSSKPLAVDFIRYLLSREVQEFLAREAYEIPLVDGIATPPGIPPLDELAPPKIDLGQLADMQPTLKLMRRAGVL